MRTLSTAELIEATGWTERQIDFMHRKHRVIVPLEGDLEGSGGRRRWSRDLVPGMRLVKALQGPLGSPGIVAELCRRLIEAFWTGELELAPGITLTWHPLSFRDGEPVQDRDGEIVWGTERAEVLR